MSDMNRRRLPCARCVSAEDFIDPRLTRHQRLRRVRTALVLDGTLILIAALSILCAST